MFLAEIVFPLPLDQTFYYLSEKDVIPGVRCIVSFKERRLIGIVVRCKRVIEEEVREIERKYKLKFIEETLDASPIIPQRTFVFLEWVANYYLCPLGLVLKVALPSGVFKLPQKRLFLTQKGKEALQYGELPEVFSLIKERGYDLKRFLRKTQLSNREILNLEKKGFLRVESQLPKITLPKEIFIRIKKTPKDVFSKLSDREKGLIDYLNEVTEVPEKVLKKLFSVKEINKLLQMEILERVEYPKTRKISLFGNVPESYSLTPSQDFIAEEIKKLVREEKFSPVLLYGVTGSGKSLIYLEVIREVLQRGRKVLILVPEIALTTYMEMLILKNFKTRIALLHSGLSPGERFSEWLKILNREVDIVVGARSAIFAPLEDIGLIVVDEEHDPSYKEENLPCKYNARDLALIRGQMENAVVVLGSATPSIKSFYFGIQGKYELFKLKERPETELPEIQVIPSSGFKILTESLKREIFKVLKENKSVFLYLNRRGYAPLVRCEECHYVWECPNCGIPLTYHKEENVLICHHCEFKLLGVTVCPSCKGTRVKFLRAGTERVEEEIKKIFKEVEVIRLDRDTVNTEKKLFSVLEKIYQKKSKIIIGTQLGAHGHNFPEVKLVGVIRAEEGLFIPSYKAAERTFQLLVQASGRAGRHKERGKAIFQTTLVDHHAIKFAINQDYESFFREELTLRKKFLFPPFVRMAQIKIEGIREERVREVSLEIKNKLLEIANKDISSGVQVLGPTPCPIRKLRGFYRWHLILKTDSYKKINQILKKFVEDTSKIRGMKVTIDIDPEDLL